MTNQHPLTPPPELVQKWRDSWPPANHTPVFVLSEFGFYVATEAACWGADQELEACCEALRVRGAASEMIKYLRTSRRPQPPTLKEQALAELEILRGDANAHGLGFDAPAIRRAVEALPNE
jgi:hypothetical protein